MLFLFLLDKNNHLKNVCMTYFQHFCFSTKLGFSLLYGSYKAFTHALIPQFYTTSTSDLVEYLEKEMKSVGCKDGYKTEH